jgi:hypothetical protein
MCLLQMRTHKRIKSTQKQPRDSFGIFLPGRRALGKERIIEMNLAVQRKQARKRANKSKSNEKARSPLGVSGGCEKAPHPPDKPGAYFFPALSRVRSAGLKTFSRNRHVRLAPHHSEKRAFEKTRTFAGKNF